MQNYLVFMPGGKSKVESLYPHHYELAEGLWAIGSVDISSADVCERLGIGPNAWGMVSRLGEYYGHHDGALWQKLEAWGRL